MVADPLFDRLARALAGRYTLVRELGRGGMATVYLGTDVKLGRGVAIKLLAPATRAYLGSDRFQREVLLAAQLSHPHIVPLFEADEADGLLFYVMEYVEGESLRQRLSRHGPLSVDDAVRIATEVGDALQYAHENGVIHRDIKPENILLSRGHALVTDFGIAKLMEERGSAEGPALTGAGIAVGTAAYMSPEQASGDKRIDPRSDVYALAAVLYEMLAGEPPFTGPSAQAIVARVINDPPRPIRTVRPALPVHLERALAAGLAKSPADRPRTARTFVDALASPARERRVSARQVAWMATASGVAIIGWMVWREWRVRSPPRLGPLPGRPCPVGGRGRVGRRGGRRSGKPRQVLGRGGGLDRQRVGMDGRRRPRRAGPARSRDQGGSLRHAFCECDRRIPRRPSGPTGVARPHGVPLRARRRRCAGARAATRERCRPVLRDRGHRERLPRGRAHGGDHHQSRPNRATQREVPQRRSPLSRGGG